MSEYKVFLLPRRNRNQYYDTNEVIDISSYVEVSSLTSIKKELDLHYSNLGSVKFSNINLTLRNYKGEFNVNDPRSFFDYKRDRAQIFLVQQNKDKGIIKFRGIISDDATKIDLKNNHITFRVLSLDSIFHRLETPEDALSDGMTMKQALINILDHDALYGVLKFDKSKINPLLGDIKIKSINRFINQSVYQSLNLLLLATNSNFLIDKYETFNWENLNRELKKVPSFSVFPHSSVNLLPKKFSTNSKNKENLIIMVNSYSEGLGNVINSVSINKTYAKNKDSILEHGLRKKDWNLDFIDSDRSIDLARSIVEEFKYPRIELEITIYNQEVNLCDEVTLNIPLEKSSRNNQFIFTVGVGVVGGSDILSQNFGSITIPDKRFKVVGVKENLHKETQILKLREVL